MKATFILLFCCACMLLAENCRKPKDTSIAGGGKGGTSVLLVTPEHHGGFVDSCMIYIKYGTNDAPASGIYDDSARCVLSDTTPVATFSNLTVGLYYLYAIGYHLPYTPPNVKGGVPCTIQNPGTQTIYLPTYSYQP